MAYSQSLAERIRAVVDRRPGISEKQMFGGIGFLLHGNMLVGVWQASLIARVGPDSYQDALRGAHVREFDITGKSMKGWVLVEPEGIDDDLQLRQWIERATEFVRTLPSK